MAVVDAPAKQPSRIAGMFDAIAARYDLLNHLLSAGLDNLWRRRAVASLQLTAGETVLDLCAGTGDLAIAAHRGAPGVRRVIGVDFSGAMLAIGKSKAMRFPSIVFVRGDATQVPLGDGTIDAVTIGFGIRNVEHPAAACREVFRVLRPGGRLAILEFALPRAPMLRNLYLWYFRQVLPRIGRVVSRPPSA
jgi:demethylmenaquinone methyltransferase / 2-methoxy-6-polyprenyl-1,4-benzoquinol methylase